MIATKKFLLSLGVAIISGSSILGFATQAFALPIKAGPIWNNQDAKEKCPIATSIYNVKWNGTWRTTEPGKMSVCGTNAKSLPSLHKRYKITNSKTGALISPGSIEGHSEAKKKCNIVAAAVDGTWTGAWAMAFNSNHASCRIEFNNI